MGPRSLVVGMAAFLALGCARRAAENPCARTAPSLIEVRSPNGVLAIALHAVPSPLVTSSPSSSSSPSSPSSPSGAAAGGSAPAPPTLVVCDGENRPLGTIVSSDSPPVLQFKNLAGDVEAQLSGRSGEGGAASEPWLRYGASALRLYEHEGLLRLLDKNGVPVAQIGAEANRAVAYDPGGLPLSAASLVEHTPGAPDRRMIAKPDGTLMLLVTGLHDDRAAAAFAVPNVPLAPQVLLARWLDR